MSSSLHPYAPPFRQVWRILRIPFWIAFGLGIGFLLPYSLLLDQRVQERFNDLVFAVPTRVYARPLILTPGMAMTPAALELELTFAGYGKDTTGVLAGSWSKDRGGRFVIDSRGFKGVEGLIPPRRIRVGLSNNSIDTLVDIATGQPIDKAVLDPARIATVYGAQQEERRIVHLPDVPPLMIKGLLAVEDRDFAHHIGIDFGAILRAAFANLRAGHTVQGGSTLTQQLVRNLFLERDQNLVRKFNEALLSVLVEAHYPKVRILEAYLNQVFLGQQGDQAVHGFSAAAEFYFGRRLEELRPQEMALLIGMVKGPSYYDPRRHPERALSRRNVVIEVFAENDLLTADQAKTAAAAPLGIAKNAQLPHNRFPAFMQLVRNQLTHDFSDDTLRAGNLSIFTTLDPAAQLYAEQAVTTTINGLGKRGEAVQAAGVVTDTNSGNVLAVLGSKTPGDQGFNRAMDARRPIGSLVKPFIYLTALNDSARWNLGSPVDDAPVMMPQPNGSMWSPENDDHEAHGQVPMLEALVKSMNLATVHLGMAVGVPRIQSFLQSFGLDHVNGNPSLLLGALDLSALQTAQIYEFLASGGHALPLLSVNGVVDGNGNTLIRYQVKSGSGGYQQAVGLVTWAMQQVARRGTAAAIGSSHLAYLNAAGKTGTSTSQRDSWFAGFTGQHLAVFWLGRDDNKATSLWGRTGGMRAWMELFGKLPSLPLSNHLADGLAMAWINPADGKPIAPACAGAQQFPVIAGTLIDAPESCLAATIDHLFGTDAGNPAPTTTSAPPAHP